MIDVASNVLEQLKKTARPIARAEQEASVQEIILALEDADAAPVVGSGETIEDIAWSLYYSRLVGSVPRTVLRQSIPDGPQPYRDERVGLFVWRGHVYQLEPRCIQLVSELWPARNRSLPVADVLSRMLEERCPALDARNLGLVRTWASRTNSDLAGTDIRIRVRERDWDEDHLNKEPRVSLSTP